MRAGRGISNGAALLALALALVPAVASGQSGGFQLPSGSSSAPRPAGPVDSDNPIIAPRPTQRPTPAPTATSPSPSPTIAASPVATTPARDAARPGQRPPQRPQPGTAAATNAAPTEAVGPALSASSDPAALPSLAPLSPLQAAPEPATTAPAGDWLDYWPWAAGLFGAVLAGLLGGLWWRRRETVEPVVQFEPPVVEAPAVVDSTPEPVPVAPALVEPAPTPPSQQGPLGFALEARRMSATLLNTTLQYRLELTNNAKSALGPLTVAGDMIAAHASLPVERQLALDGAVLERRHELAKLGAGETAVLTGEIRLPLAMITPIRSGDAAFFVPLARFRIEAAQKGQEPLDLARTFVVGEIPDRADAALRPFRLDLGPRVYSRIGQREVSQAA